MPSVNRENRDGGGETFNIWIRLDPAPPTMKWTKLI
jgi:hypothetical protein